MTSPGTPSLRPLVFCWQLSQYGGPVRRLRIWARELPTLVPVTMLVAPAIGHEHGIALRDAAAPGCRIRVVENGRGRWARRAAVAQALWDELASGRHNVVLSVLSGSDVMAQVLGAAVARLGRRDVRHVIHCAGSPVPVRRLGTPRGRLAHRLLRSAYRAADGVIAISAEVRRLVIEDYGAHPARVDVVPISVGAVTATGRRRPDGPPVFGVLSRLTAEKSIEHAVAALARLRAEGVDARLEVFGTGDRLEPLRALAADAGVRDAATFHGWVADPSTALATIDCLVLPSRYEGTPRSILEAGAHGVPTIATRVGGIPDIVRDGRTGWLYEYGDLDRLLDLMRMVARDPERRRQAGEACRDEVDAHHTEAAEMAALVRSLSRAVAAPRAPRRGATRVARDAAMAKVSVGSAREPSS